MVIDRVLQGSSSLIKVTLYSGSAAANPTPDTAKVTIARADGTVLVTNANASDGGTGVFTYKLSPTMTMALDTLTAVWTFTSDGFSQSRFTVHEVVGGFLCSLVDLKALYPNETDDELAARRTFLECALEDALGYAAVPRYVRETHHPIRDAIWVEWDYVRRLRDITANGVAWDVNTVAAVRFYPHNGKVMCITHVPYSAITIGYEHGKDYVTPDIQRAMVLLAQETYGTSYGQFDSRVVRREADGQAITYASPSLSGGQFATPELNRLISPRILAR